MKKIIPFAIMASVALPVLTGCSLIDKLTGNNTGKEISVAQFGAIPDDGINDFEALKKAADYCRENSGTTLILPPGTYEIEDTTALRIEREAIGGAYGENVQGVLFHPGAPYVKAFDLSDCKDITVKGDGATLLLKGWYEVITLANCKNVEVEGLSIVYNRPPNTVGKVIASDRESFEITFDPDRYTYLDSVVTGRTHFYDHQANRLYTGWASSKELVDSATIRFMSNRNPAIGDYCILRHGGHYRPAILIKESDNINLTNVKIHSQPGMGVVGHLSSDITLDGVQIVPQAGDIISTNTDATHFTSCSGTLTICNSKFRGQGDDCTNVHNYYYRYYPRGENKAEIRIENADLHAQSLDYPAVGDTMAIIDRRNMNTVGRYAVAAVDTSEVKREVVVEFDTPLPSASADSVYLVMTNTTRFPSVRILNNSVGSHLARAFLIKAPDVVIAGNFITGSCDTAIKLGAELSWNESGPVSNAIIENNYISGCGHCNSRTPTGILLSTEAPERTPYVNRNIIIRNNVFDSDRPNIIALKDGENISILNNSVSYPDFVTVDNCQNVTIIP